MSRGRWLFGGLALVQAALVGALPVLAPSSEPLTHGILWALAALMLAAGPALVWGSRPGRVLAAVAALAHWLAGLVLSALVVSSASYLYGIYGRHGEAAGVAGFVLAAMVLVVFWLIPLHMLAWLRRAGAEPA